MADPQPVLGQQLGGVGVVGEDRGLELLLGPGLVAVAGSATVAQGDTVATIEAMKMEAAITAPVAGTVERVALAGTQQVEGGDLVLVLTPSGD